MLQLAALSLGLLVGQFEDKPETSETLLAKLNQYREPADDRDLEQQIALAIQIINGLVVDEIEIPKNEDWANQILEQGGDSDPLSPFIASLLLPSTAPHGDLALEILKDHIDLEDMPIEVGFWLNPILRSSLVTTPSSGNEDFAAQIVHSYAAGYREVFKREGRDIRATKYSEGEIYQLSWNLAPLAWTKESMQLSAILDRMLGAAFLNRLKDPNISLNERSWIIDSSVTIAKTNRELAQALIDHVYFVDPHKVRWRWTRAQQERAEMRESRTRSIQLNAALLLSSVGITDPDALEKILEPGNLYRGHTRDITIEQQEIVFSSLYRLVLSEEVPDAETLNRLVDFAIRELFDWSQYENPIYDDTRAKIVHQLMELEEIAAAREFSLLTHSQSSEIMTLAVRFPTVARAIQSKWPEFSDRCSGLVKTSAEINFAKN